MNRTRRLFASLKTLGINPKMTTFAERKKVQKLVYLMDKVFGMDFSFPYSWYLHGPYSPEVTEIVFDVIEGRQAVDVNQEVLSDRDTARIDRLKSFLGKDIDSTDELELLVSLHFLIERSRNPKMTIKDVVDFLKSKKPYFTDEEIAEALDKLRSLEHQ